MCSNQNVDMANICPHTYTTVGYPDFDSVHALLQSIPLKSSSTDAFIALFRSNICLLLSFSSPETTQAVTLDEVMITH